MGKGIFKSNFIVLILILLFSVGCKYDDIEIKDVKNVKLGKTSTKEVVIYTEIEIYNPNKYKIKLKGYDLNVKINDRDFLLQEDNPGIKIPAKYHGDIPISLKLKKRGKGVFSFDTLLLFAEVIKSGSVKLEVNGNVTAGVFIFSKSIHVNEKRTVKFN